MGYALIDSTVSGGKKEEFDTKQCGHCGGVVMVPVRQRLFGEQHEEERGFCTQCMTPLHKDCATRAARFGCEPFMRSLVAQLKRQQARKRLLESI